jgi:hypothetical protein
MALRGTVIDADMICNDDFWNCTRCRDAVRIAAIGSARSCGWRDNSANHKSGVCRCKGSLHNAR